MSMKIGKWFDPYDVKHIKAYKELEKTGTWPKRFLPKDIEMGELWQIDILDKMANAWLTYMMKGVK